MVPREAGPLRVLVDHRTRQPPRVRTGHGLVGISGEAYPVQERNSGWVIAVVNMVTVQEKPDATQWKVQLVLQQATRI